MIIEISLRLLLVFLLFHLGFQDFKNRSIYALTPLVVLGISFYLGIQQLPINFYVRLLLINLFYLVVFISLLLTYFLIKGIPLMNVFNDFIGSGDLLFLFCTLAFCPTFELILYFLFSFTIALLIYFLHIKMKADSSIPLAGIMSIFMAIILIGKWSLSFNPLNIIL